MHNRNNTRGSGIAGPQYRVERRNYRGVRDTVNHMVEFIQNGQTHPDVRNVAVSAVRDVYPHDYTSEVAALFYEACRRVRYVRDPANAEMLQEPNLTLKLGAGDCDDFVVLLGSVLSGFQSDKSKRAAALGALSAALGAPVEIVTAGFDSAGGEHSHTFVRVWDSRKGVWIVLDPVAGPFTREMVFRIRGYQTRDIPYRKGK